VNLDGNKSPPFRMPIRFTPPRGGDLLARQFS
jgi:hypothetical protein